MTDGRIRVRELLPDLPLLLDSSDHQSFKGKDVTIAPGDIALGMAIGRASEYFDFFVYAIASVLVFPAVFFPHEPRLEGALYSFVIFSLAFLARPFGTIAFMAIQRSFGRGMKLSMALLMLGICTVGIAFLPGYAYLGFASIVLLSLLRIGQGIALGGSWDGLHSLLSLNAPPHRRCWYAMLGQLGAPIGFLFAGGLFAGLLFNLSSKDFLEWGWRFPFFVAFAINVVALFARLQLVTSEDYTRMLDTRQFKPTLIKETIHFQWRNLLLGAMAALSTYALFHLVTVFPLSWGSLYSTRPVAEFLAVQMIGAVLAAVGIVVSGLIADRFGRRATLITITCLIAMFSSMIPALIDGGELGQNSFILLGFSLLGLSYGQAAGAVIANFPAKYRYTGSALTTDLAWLVGAGFAPLVALGLSAYFGLASVSFYLLSGVICSLAALKLNRALNIED